MKVFIGLVDWWVGGLVGELVNFNFCSFSV
jgi:hypothetical protein